MELVLLLFGLAVALIGLATLWISNHKFPRVSFQWTAAIFITFLLILSGYNSISNSPIISIPRPPPLSYEDASGLMTQILLPDHVVKSHSFGLTVTIIRTLPSAATATSESGQIQIPSQFNPVGTPDVPISAAFGPNFDPFVVAQLTSSAFDIAPPSQDIQSLDQQSIQFTWSVTPKLPDTQVLNVSVTGIWRPFNGSNQIQRLLAEHRLDVNVADTSTPFITPGQFTLSELVTALISSAMNVPWIVEFVKKRQEKKKKQSDTTSTPRSRTERRSRRRR
ncbi:hypothetical protein KSF_108160 [Reticulibacter mediterranei]|uniref:Uncharacterized protein n=1 Tax=Reticulibacter mediterranei TaxID=2778369 RepID=A0A8J3IYD8_9CHLR|nr:hypothetical protein [Reticulibacter mediterranei]GHP00769.1 hypothetical protein KSF_108160 [Reticulibacter mediterranei]